MEMDYATKDKLRQIVTESLQAIGGRIRNEEIIILCPFHDDSRPSLNVHIGHKMVPGTYHCFSCNAKGGWYSLATKLNFDTSLIDSIKKETVEKKINDPFSLLSENLKELEKGSARPEAPEEPRGLEEIDLNFQWRGLQSCLLKKIGARLHWQKKSASYWLYLPLTMRGRLEGYTLCALKKEPNSPKYLLFGEAGKILFPFDIANFNENIFLVEGHFDALRLISCGLNALCIFGVNNWSETKKSALLSKMPKKVYILMDGDEPGRVAASRIYEDLRFGVPTEIVHLPDTLSENERYDPGNMPLEWIDHLKNC